MNATSHDLLDVNVKNWIDNLEQSLKVSKNTVNSVDETYGLFYILSQHHETLNVKLFLIKRLKSGKLSTHLKPFSPTAASQKKHFYTIDKELTIKLELSQEFMSSSRHSAHHRYIGNSFKLMGDIGESVLHELINTGRCYWDSVENPPLKLSDEKVGEFCWVINSDGSQKLKCYVEQEEKVIVFIHDAWYVDEKESFIGRLKTSTNPKAMQVLLSAPTVFPDQVADFSNVLKKFEKKISIQKPKELTIKKVSDIKPIPTLRLFMTEVKFPASYSWGTVSQKKCVGELKFIYGKEVVSWHKEENAINEFKEGIIFKISRKKLFEKQCKKELELWGIHAIGHIDKIYNINRETSMLFLIENDASVDIEDFSLYGVKQLRANGWRVDVSEDYPYSIANETIDEWYSEIEENSIYDWFGLELGVVIKGEKINLLPLLQKIIQQIKNNELNISEKESIQIKLPDGRYINVPAERVKNISNVLIELYDKEALNSDDVLQLSRLHASRLLELEKALGATQLRWFGGEKLRALGQKLTNFKGIKKADVPKEFKAKLRPYQLEGLSWLQFLREYELGGVLADDMGLGKTIQALAHITLEKKSGRMKTPSLVIAPTSLMFNWRMEAEKFSPELKVLVLHGADRKQNFDNMTQYDLILTTYPLIVRDKDILLKQIFHLLILDEAQFIKNSKNLATQISLQIKANHRVCLTGTPMENHLGELWSLFHFMMPGLLGDEKTFSRVFRTPIEKHADNERRLQLNKRIAPFLLRRTKDKVVKELPPKVDMLRHVELENEQRDLYETIRLTMQKKVKDEIAKLGLSRSHIIILDALLKLRQVCCDPRLLKMDSSKKDNAKSAKLELLMSLIPELLDEGRKILLFSQFTEMLGLIEQELKEKNIAYVKLTGQTVDRETPIKAFQEGKVPLFLISLKAGGTGLNLTAADTVIHYDPWWNPAVENQATDRAHRIGQNKTVFVYKFVTKGTVEEKILEMQNNKRALMEGLFSENTTKKFKLSDKDLQDLFEPLS